jgi:DNA-binding beta-propeller fold protein YncE
MTVDRRMRQAGASVRRYADAEVDPVAMLWRLRMRERRRSRQTVAVAFAVLAGLVAAAVLVVRTPRQPEVLLGRVAATIALPQAPAPRVIGVADGLVWVDGGNTTAIAVDPQTSRVARTTQLPARSRLEAVEPGSLWLVNDTAGTVSQADPRTGSVRWTVTVGSVEGGSFPPEAMGLQLALDGDAVWVARAYTREVVRVSRARRQVTGRTATVWTRAIAAGGGRAVAIGWAGSSGADAPPDAIQIDPQASKPTAIPVGGPPGGVAFGAGAFWVSAYNYTLARIDPASRQVVATIPLDDLRLPGSVVVAGEAVWVFASGGLLQRIDPTANQVVHTLQVGPQEVEFGRLAVGAGAVWLSDARAHTLLRIDPQS